MTRADSAREFFAELWPMVERVAVARHAFAPMAANLCRRTDAVWLGLEDEITIERLRDAEEPHGLTGILRH